MADAAAAKHLSINGGNLITDIKSLSSILKTRRTVAFVYGFMFAFVAFTVFLAFSPSQNSASPWFSNIFSISGSIASSSSTGSRGINTSSNSAYGSQFSSIFSYLLPNNNSNSNSNSTATSSSLSPPQLNNSTARSNTASSPSPADVKQVKVSPPSVKNNQTQFEAADSAKPPVLQANQTADASIPSNNKPPAAKTNQTQTTPNPSKDQAVKTTNQSTLAAPKAPAAAAATNQSANSPSKSSSANSGKQQDKGVPAAKGLTTTNYTASLVKKQGNGSVSGVAAGKQGMESLVQGLMGCNFFDGERVRDDSYPLYKPGSCPLIDEQFNCILNGRPDKDYQKYKWKPYACTLPRLDAGHMLQLLKGKRLVFVGDSLNRNMWESLVCILKGSVKDRSKVYEANGRSHFRGEASYSFIFKDFNCTIEFFVSPFLVREWEMPEKDGSKKETLRLDLVGRSSDQYKNADIIVFNTGHWWTHEKTSKGKDYYQEGSHVYDELNVLEAFRKALTTWARWVDHNINPVKSLVFFRGYSASHFSGGQWNSGGACDSEVEPIKNATYLKEYPPKMLVLEKVLRGMKTHVTYLNVTQMTDYRKDGHPSIYRKQHLSEAERRSPLHYQDCSHWCLPGVPDAWNEILYAELLINENQKRQAQKRHR